MNQMSFGRRHDQLLSGSSTRIDAARTASPSEKWEAVGRLAQGVSLGTLKPRIGHSRGTPIGIETHRAAPKGIERLPAMLSPLSRAGRLIQCCASCWRCPEVDSCVTQKEPHFLDRFLRHESRELAP